MAPLPTAPLRDKLVTDSRPSCRATCVVLLVARPRECAVSVLVAGTYYDKITREYYDEFVDNQGIWHNEWVVRQINPSGISLRIGIEW